MSEQITAVALATDSARINEARDGHIHIWYRPPLDKTPIRVYGAVIDGIDVPGAVYLFTSGPETGVWVGPDTILHIEPTELAALREQLATCQANAETLSGMVDRYHHELHEEQAAHDATRKQLAAAGAERDRYRAALEQISNFNIFKWNVSSEMLKIANDALAQQESEGE